MAIVDSSVRVNAFEVNRAGPIFQRDKPAKETSRVLKIISLGAVQRSNERTAVSVEVLRAAEVELEKQYRALAQRKGLARDSQKLTSRGFWRRQGPLQAAWLVHRIRHETDQFALDSAAEALASLGAQAARPITLDLLASSSRDQARTLLKALGWIPIPTGDEQAAEALTLISRALASFIDDDDEDFVDLAIVATRSLPKATAVEILRAHEANPAISEELRRRA